MYGLGNLANPRYGMTSPWDGAERDLQPKARKATARKAERVDVVRETGRALAIELGLNEDELTQILAYWRKRTPPDYQDDAVQDMAVAILKERPTQAHVVFGICRHIVGHLWRAWHTRQHYSGVDLIETAPGRTLEGMRDDDGARLAEYVVASVAYEARAISRLTAGQIWQALPRWVQTLVRQRLDGVNVNGGKARALARWARDHADTILAIAAP